jgi:hypothetical protein
MMNLRIMLQEGEQKFKEYIHNLRANPHYQRPDLNTEPFSKEFSPVISIDKTRQFNSKMELAEYLQSCFEGAGLKREDVLPLNGLWTWLAYIWFDQLAPITNPATGERVIREDAKYICSSDYRDYYRHLVSGPYSIYSLHGADNSNIFLYSRVNEHNDFIEQFASRQFIISHKNIVEAIHRLYFDCQRRQPKKGAQSRKKLGNIRRFVSVIQQFELTYDIYTMSADSILKLLPSEFDEWKHSRLRSNES